MNCKHPYLGKKKTGEVVATGCGRCLWCRIQRRREWTLRLLFESEQYKDKWFITLTYDEKNNPRTLVKKDLQLFIKRLRKHCGPKKIRYYAVGEYGDGTARPHYHAILFGPDEEVLKAHYVPYLQKYQSALLKEIWPFGLHDLGSVTVESIQYVAGYVHKKLYGKDKYPEGMIAPFSLMSRLIGYEYYVKEQLENVINDGALKMRGKAVSVPRAWIRKMRRADIKELMENGMFSQWQEVLRTIKAKGVDDFASKVYKKYEKTVDRLTEEEYHELRESQKQEAKAVDYYLKQYQKNRKKTL